MLDSPDYALALVVVRPELVVQAQTQLTHGEAAVLAVTLQTRDSLPTLLLQMLEREVGAVPGSA